MAVGATAIVVVAQTTDPGTTTELLLVIAAATAFVLSAAVGRLPGAVVGLLVTVALTAAMWRDGNLEVALFIGVLTTLYAAWHLGSLTEALVVMCAAAVAPAVVSHVIPEEEIAWTPWAAANVLMLVLGRSLRRQRGLIEQLEAAREALAEQAVAEERHRIARELHDLAGHTLAAVLLHVTGARHVLRRDLDEAERALIQAEAVGRGSLDQIRSTVASLRTSDAARDPALQGSARLVELVEEYRSAGLDVSAVVTPPVAGIGGPVGTALHRIGREALANVARHAPGNRVELSVDVEAGTDEAHLVVADHGRAPAVTRPGSGHFGLVGMRERARAGRGAERRPDRRRVAGRGAAPAGDRTEAGPLMIRLIIVDDQPVVRAGAARILGPDDGFQVVAECDDGDQVVSAVAAHRPDLVLMDVRMHRMDGVTAARSLRSTSEAPPVLMFTTFDEDDLLWGALDAGAAGFILKDSSAEDLIAAARAVAGGAAWLDPKVAPRVLAAFRTNVRPHMNEAARVDELTDREHDVLRLMARGATNTEIAGALIVSEATVKTHVGALFSKLGVRDRAAAIVFAYDHGIVEPHPGMELP